MSQRDFSEVSSTWKKKHEKKNHSIILACSLTLPLLSRQRSISNAHGITIYTQVNHKLHCFRWDFVATCDFVWYAFITLTQDEVKFHSIPFRKDQIHNLSPKASKLKIILSNLLHTFRCNERFSYVFSSSFFFRLYFMLILFHVYIHDDVHHINSCICGGK